MKILITSDQHLGYENSDKPSFMKFLDQVAEDSEVTDFVLLGDVVDMWRRDASGVFLENWDVVERVTTLAEKMTVHYVAGNHDFHVLKLQNHSYPFKFVENMRLLDGGFTYTFMHGYEFDLMQTKPMMEALCRVMDDEGGSFESGLWATLTRDWSDLKYFFSTIFLRKRGIRAHAERLQMKPEDRLRDTIGDVEQRACAQVGPNEILVFGHTHKPFVNKKENVVNSGSWVTDAQVHNTYVEIEKGKARLLVFGGSEITDRLEC